MVRSLSRLVLAAAVVCGGAAGCTRMAVKQKQPPDPLLLSKKPVEAVPTAGPGPGFEPAPPPAPALPSSRDFASGAAWTHPARR
jgi:hypothetical protein